MEEPVASGHQINPFLRFSLQFYIFLSMSIERPSDLLTEEARLTNEQLINDFHLKGFLVLADIARRVPDVAKRYDDLVGPSLESKRFLRPKKTVLASFAALETFSEHRLEDLYRENLTVPAVFLYRSLACEFDDCLDETGETSKKAMSKKGEDGISAQEFWMRGIHLIKGNLQIEEGRKEPLIYNLDKAKEDYIYYEQELKNGDNFKDLDPFETFVMTVEMRKRSFGNISKAVTRVLTKGVENRSLENKMANATVAFGVIDGFADIKEDYLNGTMTEARALIGYFGNKTAAVNGGIRLVSNTLLGKDKVE
jgi:hypothetical protein